MAISKNYKEIEFLVIKWLIDCRNECNTIEEISIGQIEGLLDLLYQLERKEKEKGI